MSVFLVTNNNSFSSAKVQLFFITAYFFGFLVFYELKRAERCPPESAINTHVPINVFLCPRFDTFYSYLSRHRR